MTTTMMKVPLTEDPFKAHILNYDYDSDTSYNSDDDDHSMEGNDDKWADLEEEYEKKEDEDVAVFRAIVDHMPIESLLHLLQGHVRAMQNIGKPLETTVDVYENAKQKQEEPQDATMSPEDSTAQQQQQEEKAEAMRVEKQFRWALEEDYSVKVDIHEIETMKSEPLWLTGQELSAIKQDLVRQIRFFLSHHQERVETLDKVVSGDGPELVIEECIKELTRHSIGRGLEGHMSRLIQQTRRNHVREILQAQCHCIAFERSHEEKIEMLRERSLVNGEVMKLYAQRMAKSDEIEALTAKMSRWEPTS